MADELPSWRERTARDSILAFVDDVTDPGSVHHIPPVDRVAVFDNDGTLAAESPCYTQLAFALDRAAALGRPTTLGDLHAGGRTAIAELVGLTHGSISTDEFDDVCRAWMAAARHPSGRPYSAMVYRPMLELIALLERRRFTCWVVSGGGTDFMRTWATDVYGLEPHRLVGSTSSLTFGAGPRGPELRKGTDIRTIDDGSEKPVSIHRHIGRRPILAAGNTDGDLPMLEWTAASRYRSLQLVVRHTDGEREYAYERDPVLGTGTDDLVATARRDGWVLVDMAADWSEVFASAAPARPMPVGQ